MLTDGCVTSYCDQNACELCSAKTSSVLTQPFLQTNIRGAGLRRRYEVDDQLTQKEHIIRWSVVVAGFGLALFVHGSDIVFGIIRVGGLCIGLAFLAWTNCAHTVGNLFAKNKTLTPP